MSLLEQLGARLTATADELPLAPVALAAERLRVATDLLMWVRQSSTNPLAVPQLGSATEHLEQAGHAMRVGQDSLAEYLAAIGLGYAALPEDPLPGPAGGRRGAGREADRTPAEEPVPPSPLRRWWTERVNQLAGDQDPGDAGRAAGAGAGGTARDAVATSDELLRRVAVQVRSGDRERLRRELADAQAPVGLGMAALAPVLARRLATDLLGHPPGPADAEELAKQTRDDFRSLLPRLPEDVVPTLLARVCRMPPPPPDQPTQPSHPTDAAVAGAVLTGLLARRLDRDPETLAKRDPDTPEKSTDG